MVFLAKALLPGSLKHHVKTALGMLNMQSTLLNMKRNGFSPKVIIDVGAYSGDWTRLCKCLFPVSQVLMIEPQAAMKRDLEHLMAESSGVELASVLVGATPQATAGFYYVGSASSVLPEAEKNDLPSVYLPMTTLDALTIGKVFARPDLIKLDVQGYEVEVLKGGPRTLAGAEVVVMEVNLIAINKGAPLFHDVVKFMADRGFQVYDICTFYRRPYDRALWQTDVVFIRSSSPLVSSNRWS